jgi:hypothetical protein
MEQLMRSVILSTVIVLAPVSLAHADFVGVAFSGKVYRINDQSGAATQINSAISRMNSLAGLYTGKLYTTGGAVGNLLASIDPETGALLGSIALSVADFRSAAFSPSGELFATHTITLSSPRGFLSELMKIDIHTGSLTSLGVLPLGIGALTFSSDGTLYGWDIGASGNADGLGLVKLAIDGSGFTDVIRPSVHPAPRFRPSNLHRAVSFTAPETDYLPLTLKRAPGRRSGAKPMTGTFAESHLSRNPQHFSSLS